MKDEELKHEPEAECCWCLQPLRGIAANLYLADIAHDEALERGDHTVPPAPFPDPDNRDAWYALAVAHAAPGEDPERPVREWVAIGRGDFWEESDYFSVELSPYDAFDLERRVPDPEEFMRRAIRDALQKLRSKDGEAR